MNQPRSSLLLRPPPPPPPSWEKRTALIQNLRQEKEKKMKRRSQFTDKRGRRRKVVEKEKEREEEGWRKSERKRKRGGGECITGLYFICISEFVWARFYYGTVNTILMLWSAGQPTLKIINRRMQCRTSITPQLGEEQYLRDNGESMHVYILLKWTHRDFWDSGGLGGCAIHMKWLQTISSAMAHLLTVRYHRISCSDNQSTQSTRKKDKPHSGNETGIDWNLNWIWIATANNPKKKSISVDFKLVFHSLKGDYGITPRNARSMLLVGVSWDIAVYANPAKRDETSGSRLTLQQYPSIHICGLLVLGVSFGYNFILL